jgi:hypothetical protein
MAPTAPVSPSSTVTWVLTEPREKDGELMPPSADRSGRVTTCSYTGNTTLATTGTYWRRVAGGTE